jgi:hypothetical protein
MIRSRLVPAALLIAAALLAFAASAGAKPHRAKGGSDLTVTAPKGAKLAVGKTTKLKVSVADHGHGAIAGVVLQANASKGITVKPAEVMVGKLTPGKKWVATFKVTATSAAKPALAFVAKAPGEPTSKDAVALKIGGGSKGSGGGGGKEEAKKVPAIVGRYFWRTELILNTTYVHGYYIVDEHNAYRGIPKGGLPTTCDTPANGEADGCVPYTWNEATGALNVGGETGEFKPESHVFELNGTAFSEAIPAEAGSKWDLSGSYINGFGICPLSCSFTTIELQMSSNGEFARAAGVSGFFGEGGSYTALPPEDHGTYNVGARGQITFNYADGHTSTETIAVMLDSSNNPDPNYGIMLGEDDFFGPHSDIGS